MPHYHRRPSLWVEPKFTSNNGWGKGAVQLVELPAPDETFDNIVAFWNPGRQTGAGPGTAVQLSSVLGRPHAVQAATWGGHRH